MPEGARLQEMHLEDAVDGKRGDVLTCHAAHLHQMLKMKRNYRHVQLQTEYEKAFKLRLTARRYEIGRLTL